LSSTVTDFTGIARLQSGLTYKDRNYAIW